MKPTLILCLLLICTVAVVVVTAGCEECTHSVLVTVCAKAGLASCCGNGILETGEECDDGNFVDGDGCKNCKLDGLSSRAPMMIPNSDTMQCNSGVGGVSTKIASSGDGTLYLAMSCYSPSPDLVALSISRDNGATWSAPETEPFSTLAGPMPEYRLALSALSIAANGPYVIMVWHKANQANLHYVRSTDYGVTWSPVGQLTYTGAELSLNVLYIGNIVYISMDDELHVSMDNGDTFTARTIIAGSSSTNKDLRFEASTGRLWCLTIAGDTTYSTDHGVTWSSVEKMLVYPFISSEGAVGKDYLFIADDSGDITRVPETQRSGNSAAVVRHVSDDGPEYGHFTMDTDGAGNLYVFYGSRNGPVLLDQWLYADGSSSPLATVPGFTPTAGVSAFPAMFVDKGPVAGLVLAWTTVAGNLQVPASYQGVWVQTLRV